MTDRLADREFYGPEDGRSETDRVDRTRTNRVRNGAQIEFETELKSSSKRNAKSSSNRTSVETPLLLEFSIFVAAAAAAGAPVDSSAGAAAPAAAAAAAAKIVKNKRTNVERTAKTNGVGY